MKTVLGSMTFSDQVDIKDAASMINLFVSTGSNELDTAYVYNEGKTESLLGMLNEKGELNGVQIASKANPKARLTRKGLAHQIDTSLSSLGLVQLDLYYLHSPDLEVPIMETLGAINEHHKAGKFKRFGLSNYAAWQVAEIVELCRANKWIEPSVYQGMYNAITRDVEKELFLCLDYYGISFYVYNPLAGGLLTGKHSSVAAKPDTGRFGTFEGYSERYWKEAYFTAIEEFVQICQREGVEPASAALRWLRHHSALAQMSGEHAVILGASSVEHLKNNLQYCQEGELPQSIIQCLDSGWEAVRPYCIKYFRP